MHFFQSTGGTDLYMLAELPPALSPTAISNATFSSASRLTAIGTSNGSNPVPPAQTCPPREEGVLTRPPSGESTSETATTVPVADPEPQVDFGRMG